MSKFSSLKQQIFVTSLGFRDSRIQEWLSWIVLAQGFTCGHNRNASQNYSHLKTKGSISKFIHMVIGRSQIFIGYWPETAVLGHLDLSISCLSVFMTWQLASHRVNDLKERAIKAPVPLNRILEVTCIPSAIFYWSLETTSIWCGRRLQRGKNTKRWGSLWVILEASYLNISAVHNSKLKQY